MHAHLLVLSTPRKHVRDFCCLQRTFTSEERDEPDFSARVDIHFKVVVQSPSKDSSKTRSQPRELVKIEYYCATKKQQYIRWNYYDNTFPLPAPFFLVLLKIFPTPVSFLEFPCSDYRSHTLIAILSLSLSLSCVIVIIFFYRCSYVPCFIRFHRFLERNNLFLRIIIRKIITIQKFDTIFYLNR